MLDPTSLALVLIPLARLPLPGGEITAYDRISGRVLVTSATDVHALEFNDKAELRGVGFARLGVSGDDVTHIAIDPAGRGFVAVCLVPERFGAQHGYVVFFDPLSLKEISRIGVGHNPDSCAFSPGGEFLVVANEGQAQVLATGEILDPPGSVTVIDLRRVREARDLSRICDAQATTVLFSGAAMDAALASTNRPRIATRNAETPALDVEPEYVIAPNNQTAYVSLQENNAIAEISLDPPAIRRVAGLGLVPRSLDGSDVDGALTSSWSVDSLPMPDQIASFVSGGARYLVLAEEGDTRGEQRSRGEVGLADVARARDLVAWFGIDSAKLDERLLGDHALGRLHVLVDMADADGNGRVDTLVALGTRSIGVYDASTMERVGDSGSSLETATMLLTADDSRSDDRGPEPEGVVVTSFGERTIAFVSLERPGAIACVDLSVPANPSLLSVYPSAWDGDLAPEGMCVIETAQGKRLLVVCYEGSGTVVAYEVRVTLE